jgi:tRNA/tmRNA/rRNA uracil-C5-methylase (TrmA/RlmC/RlmD family)
VTNIVRATGEKLVATGACLSRQDDGEIVFVDGLLPGEVAEVETQKRAGTKFATAISIENPSVHRVQPPCPYVAAGCGGCDWQHIDINVQPQFKREIVIDALTRLGKIDNADSLVQATIALPVTRYRTSARVAIEKGKWGFFHSKSHHIVPIEDCLVMHEECCQQARDAIVAANGESVEASIRRAPDAFCDVNLAVSPKSFFQSHIDAPQTLTKIIGELISGIGENLHCVDLYSGVGIIALYLAANGHSVVAVEGNKNAVNDAQRNLATFDARIVHCDVRDFRYEDEWGSCDVVVADPSREGITKEGIDALLSCDADHVILISCDPASGARDVRLLNEHGYELKTGIPIDMFGHTHHVETVMLLSRVFA